MDHLLSGIMANQVSKQLESDFISEHGHCMHKDMHSLIAILTDISRNIRKQAGIATLSTVDASTSGVPLLNANNARKAFTIYNDSSSAMYLAYNNQATNTAYTVKIPANNLYESPPDVTYTGIISALWDSATGSARITEIS